MNDALAKAQTNASNAPPGAKDQAEKQLKETQREADTRKAAAAKTHSEAAARYEVANTILTRAEKQYDDALQEYKKSMTEAEGLLHKNADPSQAQWVDLFRGEEIGNYRLIDMSKVQMFFFTVMIILAYGASVIALLYSGSSVLRNPLGVEYPSFSNSLNALLGFSHGAYLSVKTVDHTKTAS